VADWLPDVVSIVVLAGGAVCRDDAVVEAGEAVEVPAKVGCVVELCGTSDAESIDGGT